MVATRFDFNPPDVTVPHGGPPFHGWKKGWGFGQSKGPGGFVHDVSIPAKLRCSPDGDRGFASSPFWRSRLEVGKASSFGIGPRPDYGLEHKDSVPPDTYGDVSKKVDAVRATAVRKGITVKSKFPSMEERYRDMSWPQCGPGPAKYDTSYACGQSSWTSPAKLPAYTMGVRKVFDQELIYRMREPGPDEYHTRGHPGRNSQIKRGTLYDISMKGRLPFKGAGYASPGPAKYHVRGQLDEYGLWTKISNVKPARKHRPPPGRREAPDAAVAFSASTGALPSAATSMPNPSRCGKEASTDDASSNSGEGLTQAARSASCDAVSLPQL